MRLFFYYIFLLRNFVRDPISQNPNIISAFLSSCLVSDRIVIWLIIKVLLVVVVIVTVHADGFKNKVIYNFLSCHIV